MLKVYKGMDKDMKCRGMQYELGKKEISDDAIRCGEKGFHSCEAPFDVLRYYPNKNGNRFFEGEAAGKIDRIVAGDSKIASSEFTLKTEISFAGLVKAQIEFTRKRASGGVTGGDRSNLAGGDWSNLAGGNWSNLAGGDWSNLAGGDRSNLAGGDRSNLAGGNDSNLAGGDWSNLAGGNWSNLAGGDWSNLAGGDWSNLAGGDRSNLAGGDRSNLAGGNDSNLAGGKSCLISARNECVVKADLHSVIVLTQWEYIDDEYKPICVKAGIVDGDRIKPNVWYRLENGEFVESEENK